jgi:hypothetical protein
MKLYTQFLSFSKGKQIAIGVCLTHLLILFTLTGHHLFTRRTKPPRPIVVRTLAAPVHIATPQERPTPKAKPSPSVKVEKPPLTHPPTPNLAPQKPSLKPKATISQTPKTHTPSEIKKEVIQTLPSTGKITTNKAPLFIPKTIQPKAEVITESPATPADPTSSEIVIAFLQDALQLPEYGEVRAKIEIDSFGHVVNLEFLEAKSVKNKEFLQKQLPDLLFPCLNGSTQTFTITFRNVEIR